MVPLVNHTWAASPAPRRLPLFTGPPPPRMHAAADPTPPPSPSPSTAWHARADPPPLPHPASTSKADGRHPLLLFVVLLSTVLELELPPLLHRLSVCLTSSHHWKPLRFPSECHRLCRFTVRPSHSPLLSLIEVALTFPLLHRHCRVVPASPLATGALFPLTNAAVP
jgi:hypothetical protein